MGLRLGTLMVASAALLGVVPGAARSTLVAADSTTPGTGAPASAPGPGDFGDLQGVCGPGDAKGATAQGVTDTSISVGTLSDPGFQFQPGLNQEIFDSADAFAAWCNEAGGILGRKLEVTKRDAKGVEVGARIVEACEHDFMLVGNGNFLDNAAVEPRLKCKLPQIPTYLVSEAAATSPLSILPLVGSVKQSTARVVLEGLKASDPSVLEHLGIWNLDFPSTLPVGLRDQAAAKELGYTEALYEAIPAVVDNWRPFVERLKAKDVQVLVMVNAPGSLVVALKSMADAGYFPKYIVLAANFYDPKLIEEGGENLDKTKVVLLASLVPFERAAEFPATKQYVDILTRYGGFKPRALGVQTFSAFLLFAEAAKACGSELTRECVMSKAASFKDWSGGGLHTPNTPGDGNAEPPHCFHTMQATSKGFVPETAILPPTDGKLFHCS